MKFCISVYTFSYRSQRWPAVLMLHWGILGLQWYKALPKDTQTGRGHPTALKIFELSGQDSESCEGKRKYCRFKMTQKSVWRDLKVEWKGECNRWFRWIERTETLENLAQRELNGQMTAWFRVFYFDMFCKWNVQCSEIKTAKDVSPDVDVKCVCAMCKWNKRETFL